MRRGRDRTEAAMRVLDVADGGPLLASVHREVLTPSFTADELESLGHLRDALARGAAVVTAATDDDGAPVAAAVGEWDPGSRVLLLSYLAVRPGLRGRGVGSLLMERVAGAWQERFRPLLTLVEVAHPLAHGAHEAHGDPAARLRFYARYGARALDIPYFQPALRADTGRVHGMLLLVLTGAPGSAGEAGDTVAPGPVRAFLDGYLLDAEGPGTPDGGAVRRVREALERPGGVRLLPLDRPEALPLSVPDGP